jgi:arylformamidase
MGNNICLSHLITQNTPSYGNRDHVLIRSNSSVKHGETANTSTWIFSNNHIGTHIDSPYHFCETGKKTYEIPVDEYIFNRIQLIDIPCSAAKLITISDIESCGAQISKDIEMLFIRTGFENFREEDRYWNDNPGLASELAAYFRKNYPQLRCIGFDFMSITSWKFRAEGRKSHNEFLCPEHGERAILAIEDMSLNRIEGEINWVVVAPIFVEDGNGGAVTVFANQNDKKDV